MTNYRYVRQARGMFKQRIDRSRELLRGLMFRRPLRTRALAVAENVRKWN